MSCDTNKGTITDGSDCQPCEPGYYSKEGSNQCIACSSNTVQPRRQSGECIACGENTFGRDEARTACECDIGYYLDDYDPSYPDIQTCIECVDGADCSAVGTRLSLMGAAKGYWRRDVNRMDFTKCYFPHRCEGGYYSECGEDGQTGYICMECDDSSFEYIRSGNQCWKCPDSTAETSVYIMFTIICSLFIFSFILCAVNRSAKNQLNVTKERDSIQTAKAFKAYDDEIRSNRKITTAGVTPATVSSMTKAKLLILDFQCIAKITIMWSREWSPAFSRFAHWLDLLNFDLIHTSAVLCVDRVDYYTQILLTILLPLITFGLILLCYVVPETYCRDWKPSYAQKQRTKYKTTRIMIFFIYLLYIPTTTVLFTIYSCVPMEDGYYLYFHLDTECYTDEWIAWNYVCGLFGGLFVFGIPCFFQLILWSNRTRLAEPDCLVKYGIIYGAYENSMVYVDAIELVTRWVLISFVALLPGKTQPYVGLVIVALMIMFILFKMPYRSPVIDRLHLLSYVNLTVIILATIVYQEIHEADDLTKSVMDFVLVFSVCIIFVTSWAHELTGQTVTDFVRNRIEKIGGKKNVEDIMPQDHLMSWGQMKNDINGKSAWRRLSRRNLDDDEHVRQLKREKKQEDGDDNVEQWTMNPLYIEPI